MKNIQTNDQIEKELYAFFVYDFVIKELNLIIEYYGETWHPNPQLSENDKKLWRNPISKITYDTHRARDLEKERVALKNGFKYVIIWSSDDKNQKINETIELITILHQ